MMELTKLKSPAAWASMRAEIAGAIGDIVGAPPRERVDVQAKTVDEYEFRGYVRRRINYFVEGWERMSAWLFVPEGKEEAPGLLCCHQEAPQGKDEPAGIEGDARLAFAQHYAELGYVTLAPDCITAGDRVSGRKAPFDTKPFYKEHPKASAAGKMLADHMSALDVFSELKRVDTARIGVVGHGLGGFNALLLAAFDERVQACVSSCGFTRFATDKDPGRWAREEGLVLLPQLRPWIEKESFPFDFEHILAMAAPSAVLVCVSLSDSPFSNPRSCKKAVSQAKHVYKLLGAPGAIDCYAHHDGHCVTQETLEIGDEWFERWL